MKILVHRILLLTLLILAFAMDVTFLVVTLIGLIQSGNVNFDQIMYIICFILSLSFIGLEIFNTIISFKNGSNFIKNLAYNDDNSLNSRFLLLVRIGCFLILGILIYAIIICFNNSLFLANLELASKELIIVFTSILLVDALAIATYPFFDKLDK